MPSGTRPLPYGGAIPGGAATVTIYDNGAAQLNSQDKSAHELQRVRVVVFTDAAATFFVKWQAPGGTLRTMNGPATPPVGEVIAANVPFERDCLVLPGRTQITILTGAGPTVFELSAEGVFDQGLAQ